MELLSLRVESAGFGIMLCFGPFWTVPFTHVSAPKPSGTMTPVKSSLACSLNSTRIVRSLATWVVLALLNLRLIALGLLPVFIAWASSLASWRAATGLPLACLASKALAFSSAVSCALGEIALPLLPTFTSELKAASARGATVLR
jgi:hypothetical protein